MLYVLDRGHGLQALAVKVALVADLQQALPVCQEIVAVVLWESCKDFQRVWEA